MTQNGLDGKNTSQVAGADEKMDKVVIGDCDLYHGDCMELMGGVSNSSGNWLPQLAWVDAIITSPPYNTLRPSQKPSGLHAERSTGINEWMEKQDGYFDQKDEDQYQIEQQQFLELALKNSPIVWINHKTRYRNGVGIHPLKFYKAPLFAEIVWDRGCSMALNCGRYSPSHEYIFGFGKPKNWDNKNNSLMSVWRIPPGEGKTSDNDHPCPFPERLIAPIVSSCVFTGRAVDPFMGSGTVGVVCAKQNKKFLGIEKERKYFDIACKRIEDAYRQQRLFA